MAQRNLDPFDDREASFPGWSGVLAAVAVLGGLTWAAWRTELLAAAHLAILYAVVLGAFLNVLLFSLLLWGWARATEKRRRILRYREELGYLRSWSGEEGRRRKTGLIRALNELDAAPRELENAVLARADLKGANLRGCNLKNADLRRADLQGALLDGADLRGADLSGANLSRAGLSRANLRGCNLEDAELAKVRMDEANLHRANLVNANLYGTDLARVRLERARFAVRGEGGLLREVHSSVEDWVRERLDEHGLYNEPGAEGTPDM